MTAAQERRVIKELFRLLQMTVVALMVCLTVDPAGFPGLP